MGPVLNSTVRTVSDFEMYFVYTSIVARKSIDANNDLVDSLVWWFDSLLATFFCCIDAYFFLSIFFCRKFVLCIIRSSNRKIHSFSFGCSLWKVHRLLYQCNLCENYISYFNQCLHNAIVACHSSWHTCLISHSVRFQHNELYYPSIDVHCIDFFLFPVYTLTSKTIRPPVSQPAPSRTSFSLLNNNTLQQYTIVYIVCSLGILCGDTSKLSIDNSSARW